MEIDPADAAIGRDGKSLFAAPYDSDGSMVGREDSYSFLLERVVVEPFSGYAPKTSVRPYEYLELMSRGGYSQSL